jgi:vancomycin permeability regulator SanA
MRELIARVLAVLDLYVWNKKPEIMGKESPI